MPNSFDFNVSVCIDNKTGRLEAVYFQVRRGKAARTEEVQENVLIDYDDKGKIMGVELLGPCSTTIIERILERKRAPVAVRRFVRDKIPMEMAEPDAETDVAKPAAR